MYTDGERALLGVIVVAAVTVTSFVVVRLVNPR
jgi:hypothetical protein